MTWVVPSLRAPREGASPVRRQGGGVWTGAALLLVVFGSAFPVYWSFLMATQTQAAVSRTPPTLLPGSELLENVRRVFDRANFGDAMGNSLLVASVVTVSVVFLSTTAGFAFAKLRFRGQRALMAVVLVAMMIPPQVSIVPLYILMNELGWAGQLRAVIVPSMVSAFGVCFMWQYLSASLPTELVEAARVDGCSTGRTLWHVVFPAARPAAAVLALFTFVQTWNDFFWPLVVLTPDNATVQVALSTLSSGYYEDFSLVLTGSALATLPILLLFAVMGRHVVRGTTYSRRPGL